jgi:hypothetical protein
MAEGDSPRITISALSTTKPSTYTTLLPIPDGDVKKLNSKVTNKSTLAYTIIGEYFKLGPTEFQASPEDFEFAKMFWELSRELLQQGKLKVHRPSVDKYGKGLEGILEGLDAMRKGKVSGEKLVYTI